MIFFLLTLLSLRIVGINSQGYKRIILTGEHKINLGYNGTTDTISAQKTVNLYKINPSSSTEQSTISFWFKPSVNQFNPLLRRRVLQTTQMNQNSGQISKDGQSYNVIYLNYTAYDPFNLFNTYLTSYSSSFVFNILGTGSDKRCWTMIAASYQNTGSTYNFIFQTNSKSFNVPLSLYSFDPFNWVFVSVGVDYTVSNALMTFTFIQNDIVLQGYVNLDTPMKFLNASINFGALSKYPNEFQKNSACNCGVSSVIWYVDIIFNITETFDLRRTYLSPIYSADFSESADNIVSFSVDPPTNYFVDYYNDGSSTLPSLQLGTGTYGDSTFPTYKRMIMGIQFQQNNIANFNPGFNMATFNKVDFTMSFWVRIDFCDSTARYFMSNANFDQFRFFLIFVQQANGQNMFYLTVFDEYKLLIPFQLGSWYLFLVSICNFLPSPKLFINALFLNNTSSSTYYSSFKAVYDATQFQFFITNINANSKSFQIGPSFTGIIKSFRYYRGAYFFPPASFKVDLPNCLVPISYPKTYFIMDGVTPGLNIPNECLLCKSGYYWDPNNKVCSNSLACDISTQHDFRDINTKCENCGTNCVFSVCGNGVIEGFELCDDGQTGVASGCSVDCKSVKSGWSCTTLLSGNIPKSSCMSNCAVKNCMDCSIDATKCNFCYLGSFLDTVNKSICYNPLPTGYYMTQDTNGYSFATPCSVNLNNCAICTNGFYCKNCTVPSVYALLANGLQQTCVNACPSGYFIATDSSGTKFCNLCSVQNCSKCDTSPTDKCDQCNSGFLLDTVFFKCFLTIPYNYYYSNLTAGLIRQCASDINFCDTCQNNMMCTKCMNPYNLYSITSSTIPPPGTYTYCVQDCPSNTYLTTSNSISICLPCKVSNCNSCPSNPNKCTVCNTGKLLDLLNSICFDSQPTDYYIVNSTALTMMPCNNTLPQCTHCINSSFCNQCSANFVLFTNYSQGTCNTSCPVGFYVQNQTNGTKKCQPCSKTNCDDCSVDPNQCVKCKSGKYLDLVNYNCLDKQTNDYYVVNQTLLTIKPCNSSITLSINCETCNNETFCTKCTSLSSWSLFSLPTSNTNVCLSQCPTTYYVSSLSGINICVACPVSFCSICSANNPNTCTKCISGNFMDVNTTMCYGTPPSNFYVIDAIQMTIQNCGIPINNCLQCSNGSYCTSCNQSTFLFQNGYSRSCVSSCSPGYYLSGVNCLPCSVSNCSVCPGNICSQCIPNNYLDFSNKNTCFTTIPNGYYISSSISPLSIMPCNYTLAKCIQCNSSYFCTQCSADGNYVLFINNSQSTCNTSCPAGYYIQTQANGVKQCQPCNKINCDDCSTDPNQCVKCKSGKYLDLVNYNCLDNKNSNYYFVNQTLLTIKPCNTSSILSINCETCSNETYCTQCTSISTWSLFSYQNSTSVCLSQCPSGYYVSSLFATQFCQGCPDANCSVCSANNPNNCSKCIQGNYIDVNTTRCFGSLPNGFFVFNSSQMIIENCSNAIESCLQCLNRSYCTYCNPNSLNLLLLQNGNTQACVPSCSEGYYISGTTNKSCLPCAVSNCSVCPGGICNQCIKNQSLDITNNSTCFDSLPNGYFYTDQNHTYVQACNRTLSSCNQCVNSTECQSCALGTLSTVNGSTICASNCPASYYQGSVNGISKCLPCLITNCSDCSVSPASCIKCFSDNYMDEDTQYCYNPIPNNSYLVSQSQMLIQKCNVSLNNCIQCANKTFCNKCLNNIPLLQNHSKRICVQSCPQEYFMTTDSNGNNFCEYCNVENCSDCVQDPNKCTKCLTGKYLDISTNDTCYDAKPDGFYFFNLNLGEIQPCGIPLDHCELCQNSNFCTQCIPTDNWALYLNKTSLLQKCLSVCPEAYFKNQSTNPLSCSSCPGVNCSDCSGADPTYCNACLADKFRDELTTICYDYKPDTHYISDPIKNFILPCNFSLKNCQQCINSSYCSLCTSNFALFMNNSNTKTCLSVCPSGFYLDQTINSNKSCLNCIVANCSDCSLFSNKCSACINPNFLDISTNQTCFSTIPKTHYIYDWRNYLISSCQSAINNCQECLNSTFCTLCYPSKYLDISTNQTCYDSIPKTHFLYDSVLNQIKFCNSSLKNCQECSNSTYCNICQSPFGLCFSNQTRICVSSCPNGYFMNSSDNLNQTCQLCSVANCSDCSLNSVKCSNCFSPNFLDISTNLTCYDSVPSSHFLVDNSTNKIAPCNSTLNNCSQCANSSTCNFCSLPYTLNSKGACISMCSAGYYLNDQGSFRSCQKCPVINCSDCYSETQKCFLCLNNKYLDIETPLCFDSVPNTYFLVQNSTQNLIKLCNSTLNSCLECLNDRICTKCSGNLFLHSDPTNPCTNECPNGYYHSANNSCLNCLVENCSNCSSDPSKCSRCLPNKYLDPIQSICYNNVSKDHFLVNNNSKYSNLTNQTENVIMPCNSSIPNCAECANETFCETCHSEKYFLNASCQTCANLTGFYSNCSEICGDGYLFNSSKSGHQCDDGNNIDGDGCSSSCQNERNWKCVRESQYKPDHCFESSEIDIQLFTRSDNPEKIIVHPSRPLKVQNESLLLHFFNISLLGVDKSNYSLDARLSQLKGDIEIIIDYKVTVKNMMLSMNLVHQLRKLQVFNQTTNSSELCDENNIPISEKYYTDPIILRVYDHENYNQEQTAKVDQLHTYTSTVTATLAISTSSLSIFQTLNIFWLMVDAMQIANFFLYINIFYPSNLQTYFKILSSANLNFIPNPFNAGTNDNDPDAKFKIFGKKIVDQRAPLRFESLGKTSLFLKNAGLQLIILISVWVFYYTIIGIDYFLKRRNTVSKMSMHIVKLREKLEFGLMIQVHLMILLEFSLGCLLQVRNISYESIVNGWSSTIGLLGFIYILLFFLQIGRVVNMKNIENEEFKKKYDILFEEYQKEKFIQRNYPALVLVKKYLMVLVFVMVHDCPSAELALLMSIFLAHLGVLIIGRPFKRRLTNAVMILSETIFIVVICLIFKIFLIDYQNEDLLIIPDEAVELKITYGWVIIALISFILFSYLVVFFRQQVLILMEFFRYLQNSKLEYRKFLHDVFRKKNINKPVLKSLVSSGSLGCEMVEDPYKQISEDQIDEKYLHVETLPETSFSKFVNNFKTKNTTNTTQDNKESKKGSEEITDEEPHEKNK